MIVLTYLLGSVIGFRFFVPSWIDRFLGRKFRRATTGVLCFYVGLLGCSIVCR